MLLETLLEKGAIWFERIEEGFNLYPYYLMEGSEDELYKKLKVLVEKNGYENSYVDFYYGRLTEDAKELVRNALTKEEVAYLDSLDLNHDTIYFPLNETLLEITAKLSVQEVLFSTYYFCKYPCTVWGNYNRKFPVFIKG